MHNLRHVVYIARSYSGYGLNLGDLIQEGNIGLMKAIKKYDPDKNLKLIRRYSSKLGIKSFLVGGYVRDLILNRSCKDIDIMTIGEPYKLIKSISEEKGFSDVKVFKTFGTASISFNSFNYEFVGARKESYSKNSRNPKVVPGLFLSLIHI